MHSLTDASVEKRRCAIANEITLNVSLTYEDSEGTDVLLDAIDIKANVSTKKYQKAKVSVGTSEEAIPLGEVTSLGWCLIKNLDATNYVEVRSASGAANDIIKVLAGKAVLFQFGSDVTAPFWIANTDPCQVEYLLVSQ